MPRSDVVLSIEGLSISADVRGETVWPVTDVHVSVRAGEVVGLVGESGSGKSLTALSVPRLLPENVRITDGLIRVAGKDMSLLTDSELSRVRGGVVGMVFQDSLASLNPTKTIGQQVAEVVRLHDAVSRTQAEAKAVDVLADVGLPQPRERFRSYPHQLSGGMRQRVAIAMAIACEPQLVIADEPTTALDVTVQAQILALLRRLVDDRGMGVLLITHDLGVVANVADRTTVMYGGRTVEDCTVIDAFEAMRHPYTEALVASAPRLSGLDSAGDGIPGAPPNPAHPEPGCPFEPRCSHAQSDCVVAPPPYITADNGQRFACFHPLLAHEVSRG